MIAEFHFLRPWALLILLPLLWLFIKLWRQKTHTAWDAICDPHLLAYLMQNKSGKSIKPDRSGTSRRSALLLLFSSALLLSFAMAGPSWKRIPQASYQSPVARVLVLDMSSSMLEKDLKPDRLSRAKFKLHDILSKAKEEQYGLVVYTGQPFVVSPLTEDSLTIDALLDMLLPDIMPVEGQRLDAALEEGAKLIGQAGFSKGQLLVLTASIPDEASVNQANDLSKKGFYTSVMPIVADPNLNVLFEPLARAGGGRLIPFNKETDLSAWLFDRQYQAELRSSENTLPLWKDEGLWFVWPALLFLTPVFRRTWLQRI